MAVERDFELLDDYLANRLSAEDATAFEKQLQAEPQLARELNIQKSITEGIRQARAAELKAMLNNVPVPPVQGGQSLLTKVATWAVVAGLVATSVYLYLSQDEETATDVATVTSQPEIAPVLTEPNENTAATTDDGQVMETPAPQTGVEEKENTTKTTRTTEPAPVNIKPIEVYDPSQEESTGSTSPVHNDHAKTVSKSFVTSSIEVEMESMNKKYAFHYTFQDGKLILYGAFEKNLYEILEFIGDEKRTVVLFYKSSYYLLDVTKTEPTKLTAIHDQKLLKKLQSLRSN